VPGNASTTPSPRLDARGYQLYFSSSAAYPPEAAKLRLRGFNGSPRTPGARVDERSELALDAEAAVRQLCPKPKSVTYVLNEYTLLLCRYQRNRGI